MTKRYLQILAKEMFKALTNISRPIFREISHKRRIRYDLCQLSKFSIPNIRSVYHGLESLSYLGPKITNTVSSTLKDLSAIISFKKAIKQWQFGNCPCRLCKTYLGNTEFINIRSFN